MTLDRDALKREDPVAWDALIGAIANDEAPDAADVVRDLIESEPASDAEELLHELLGRRDFAYWVGFARQRLEASDQYFTISQPLRKFRDWFGRMALASMNSDDPASWDIRRDLIVNAPDSDGGFAAANQLLDDLRAHDAPDDLVAEVSLLVAKGAFTVRDFAVARRAALDAMKTFRSLGMNGRALDAQRRLAGGLLHLGEVETAMRLFEAAMFQPGRILGGGVTVFSRSSDPREEAIDEACTIAIWASTKTPEWVRAIGGLAERWDDEEQADFLWKLYRSKLDVLMLGDDVDGDFEVVVRQLHERGLLEAAHAAVKKYRVVKPDDPWGRSWEGGLEMELQFRGYKAQLESDPAAAIEGALAMFEDVVESRGMEDNWVFSLSDFLVTAMCDQGDRRAIDIQQRLWDAKLEAWGECPSAWLEEQNMGGVYCDLGDKDAGLELMRSALEKLEAQFGEQHPHVQMVKRNIARHDS